MTDDEVRASASSPDIATRTQPGITANRLESGYWVISGRGPCEWSQPPSWPCDEATLRAHAFPQASELFIRETMRGFI
jgi:hypothetical protein